MIRYFGKPERGMTWSTTLRSFENDCPLYEIMFEVGRRLIDVDLVDQVEREKNEWSFRKLYGPECVHEFLRRLERHDLLLG